MDSNKETLNANSPIDATKASSQSEEPEVPKTILIRMWPKTPVLYPVALLALIFGLIGTFAGSNPHVRSLQKQFESSAQEQLVSTEDQETTAPAATASIPGVNAEDVVTQAQKLVAGLTLDHIMGTIFLLVFALSLFTLSVDLEVRWALISFASVLVVVLLLILINQRYEFLPGILSYLVSLSPIANPQFYFAIFMIWVILMGISFAVVRFHYVRIESNEVIVVGGLLERQQRFPTMRMRYTRDIQDVFEYYLPLVRSGRLILSFSEQNEPVVIDNVLNIDKITKKLDKISGVLHVEGKN